MEKLTTKQAFDQFLENNPRALIYYSTSTCGVCQVMRPQVEQLLKDYPHFPIVEVVMDELPEVSAQQTIFASPALIIYIDGKEYNRQAGYLRLDQLKMQLERLS